MARSVGLERGWFCGQAVLARALCTPEIKRNNRKAAAVLRSTKILSSSPCWFPRVFTTTAFTVLTATILHLIAPSRCRVYSTCGLLKIYNKPKFFCFSFLFPLFGLTFAFLFLFPLVLFLKITMFSRWRLKVINITFSSTMQDIKEFARVLHGAYR